MLLRLLLLVWSALLASGALSPLESQYISFPNSTKAREYLEYYTSIPHIAGSPGDYDTAIFTYNELLKFGLKDVNVVTYDILVNYPLRRQVQLLDTAGDVLFKANLTEPVVPEDPTSVDNNAVPTFNGYSASGNATSHLVYANYGSLEDFQYLQSNNISVNGSIVIVRYGLIFRGVKAMLAQKYGAKALLIYSDPIDDGFDRGTVYPEGPWRPEFGVQRGSVQFLQICPGNPGEPGRVAACLGPEYANESYSGTLIPNIPVQPISWGDAYPLLSSLGGPVAPFAWAGGLNFTYKIGGWGADGVIVNVDLLQNYTTVTIWDVVATIPGQNSNEAVILGNHRDAWVFGATDPNSGSAVLLEVARSLALLQNTTGWVPQRDIILCSWDAEEYGLEGSTSWAEANYQDLRNRAIMYINTDVGVSGNVFRATGTPSLNSIMRAVVNDSPFPGNASKTVGQTWSATQLDVLGSGSDYTAFIDHLGIPCLDITFTGVPATRAGVYHSNYDSFYWMEHFGDPEFLVHQSLAQVLGLLLIRVADSTAHPFNYTNYAGQLSAYLSKVQQSFPVASIDWTTIETAIAQFAQASASIDSQTACVANNSACLDSASLSYLNMRLRYTEQHLLINALTNSSDGLPGRPWYKHVVQAPGLYEGYGAQTLPGITQALQDQDYTTAQQQVIRAAAAISDASLALTELSVSYEGSAPTCYGGLTGTIYINPTGGFTPLSYAITGHNQTQNQTWQTLPAFLGLSAGNYTVLVRDALNFTWNFTTAFSQPPKLNVEVITDDTGAHLNVTGGSGSYSYYWSNNSTANRTDLSESGEYYVIVIDGNGCAEEVTFSWEPHRRGDPRNGGAIAGIVIAVVVGVTAIIGAAFWYWQKQNSKKYDVL